MPSEGEMLFQVIENAAEIQCIKYTAPLHMDVHQIRGDLRSHVRVTSNEITGLIDKIQYLEYVMVVLFELSTSQTLLRVHLDLFQLDRRLEI